MNSHIYIYIYAESDRLDPIRRPSTTRLKLEKKSSLDHPDDLCIDKPKPDRTGFDQIND